MTSVLAMILAGGEGRRLDPLTRERAKPAVPFGGRYRIIDFVLSNFANSGMLRMKVLVQYKSESLNTHVQRAWRLTSLLNEYVEIVPAQMRYGPKWFEGSADAIYQNLNIITDEEPEYTFVFGADHVYRMDVRQMLDYHTDNEGRPDRGRHPGAARRGPRLRHHRDGRRRPDDRLRGEAQGRTAKTMPGDPTRCLASMGNYLFTTDALVQEIVRDAGDAASRPRLRQVDRHLDALPQAGLRLRLHDQQGAGPVGEGAGLLARRGEPRRLLPGQHGPGGRRPDLLPLQLSTGPSSPSATTTRRPSSSSTTRRTGASATPPTRSSPRAASSPAATSTTPSSRPGCASTATPTWRTPSSSRT